VVYRLVVGVIGYLAGYVFGYLFGLLTGSESFATRVGTVLGAFVMYVADAVAFVLAIRWLERRPEPRRYVARVEVLPGLLSAGNGAARTTRGSPAQLVAHNEPPRRR
jgi:hypothetical protein